MKIMEVCATHNVPMEPIGFVTSGAFVFGSITTTVDELRSAYSTALETIVLG